MQDIGVGRWLVEKGQPRSAIKQQERQSGLNVTWLEECGCVFECVLSVVAFDCFTLIGNNLTDTHYRRCLCHRVVSTDDLIQTLITVKHTHRERERSWCWIIQMQKENLLLYKQTIKQTKTEACYQSNSIKLDQWRGFFFSDSELFSPRRSPNLIQKSCRVTVNFSCHCQQPECLFHVYT